MKKVILFMLLAVIAASAQQFNTDVIPATSGLNLGHTNQRWNGNFGNVNITGNCTVKGLSCITGFPTTCTAGQTFIYNGTVWVCSNAGAGTITVINTAAGTGLQGGSTFGVVNLSLLQTCSLNQVLQWQGVPGWQCATISGGGGTLTATGPPSANQFPYWTSATNLAAVTVGLGYSLAGNNNGATPTVIKNPLLAPAYTAGADIAADINHMLQVNTNGVSGDEVDARGFLATNNVVSHSMFPQTSTGVAGWQLWMPAGKITTSVPQKIETSTSILRAVGRGGTNGLGGSELSTLGVTAPNGIGSGGSVTCTGVSGGACTGYTVVGGSGYYYNPIVTFSGGGCSTPPTQVLLITDGVITGVTGPIIGSGSTTPNGVGCSSPPSAVVASSPVTSTANNYTYNMLTGIGAVVSPYVLGVGSTSSAYLEDVQIFDQSVDCGATGTPSTPGSADYLTGLAIIGAQEETAFWSNKQTNCGIAGLDVGGRSNMAINLGPIMNNEILWPSNLQCPNPGTTYQGTPFTSGNAVTAFTSGTGGLVTVTLTNNVSQITQGQSITVSGVANGTHGEIYSTASNSSGVPITNLGAYYEIVSNTCINCKTFQYQINPTGFTGTVSTGLGSIVITPWPVMVRFDTGLASGLWHSTSAGCSNGTFAPVGTDLAGQGGLFMGNHNERTNVGVVVGGVDASLGQTILNGDNVTQMQTGWLISNQFPVQSLWMQNIGSVGGSNVPTNVMQDLLSGNTLTSAQQAWLTLYVHDYSGTAGGVFSMVDPSTANSNIYQNGINAYNGILGFYSASTTPTATITASTGVMKANIFNAATGFELGSTAPLNHCLIGNGTNYVDSASCGGGSGVVSSGTVDGVAYYTGATTVSSTTPPTANGNYFLNENVTAGVAVAPTHSLAGVPVNDQVGTTYTYLYSDRTTYVTFSNASPIAATLPQAGTAGFTSNWHNLSCNIGAGTVTITPTTSTISFTSMSQYTSGNANIPLTTGQCVFLYSDNTNYRGLAIGYAAGSIQLTKLATQTANTVLGNFTSGTASPTATAVASCSGNNNAEIYTTNTGFVCGTNFGQLNVASTWTTLQTFGSNASIAATAHGVLLSENASAVVATAVGATNTVLHGNTGADPTYSAIVAGDITSATITHTQTDSTFPTLIASGTSAMGTGGITSGTCATVVTTTATGAATTDNLIANPTVDPTGVTGYAPASGGSLYIQAYITSGNANFKVCNPTSGTLTPSALTMQWRVIR